MARKAPTFQYRADGGSGKKIGRGKLILVNSVLILVLGGIFVMPQLKKKAAEAQRLSAIQATADAEAEAKAQEQAKRDVLIFIKKYGIDQSYTKVAWYSRTVNVLDQCGFFYKSVKDDYFDRNRPSYDEHLRTIQRRNTGSPSSVPRAKNAPEPKEINKDDYKLGISGQRENALAAGSILSSGNNDGNPYINDLFEPEPSKLQCEAVKAAAKDGTLDI